MATITFSTARVGAMTISSSVAIAIKSRSRFIDHGHDHDDLMSITILESGFYVTAINMVTIPVPISWPWSRYRDVTIKSYRDQRPRSRDFDRDERLLRRSRSRSRSSRSRPVTRPRINDRVHDRVHDPDPDVHHLLSNFNLLFNFHLQVI